MTEENTGSRAIQGSLSIGGAGKASFAHQQAQLLRAIADCGSISAAAKAVGISYKTAWDRIDAMNNLANEPLVVRSAGGSQGGGTALTEMGNKVLTGFAALEAEHALFLQRLGRKISGFSDVAEFVGMGNMKTSARNQFRGEVISVTPGAVNAEVTVKISEQQSIVAVVTNGSLENLQLREGASVVALIKASWVIVSLDTGIKTSARNQLSGVVRRVERGAVNSDVTIDLGSGKSIAAVITNQSLDALALAEGHSATALFKASSVILMLD